MDLSESEGDMFDERSGSAVVGSRRARALSPEAAAVLVALVILIALAL